MVSLYVFTPERPTNDLKQLRKRFPDLIISNNVYIYIYMYIRSNHIDIS